MSDSIILFSLNSICLLSDSSSSVRISISRLVRLDANLTFCPFLPIARLNCSSGITTSTLFFSSYKNILLTSAGANALAKNVAWFSDHVTMSIFSPWSSFTTVWTLYPLMPTQAPTGSIVESWV